ncbi:hypothetical protein TKK_0004591 [Trichogramma kaykai]
MSTFNEAKCYTQIDRQDCVFTWTINDIKLLNNIQEGQHVDSQIFSAKSDGQFYFRISAKWLPSRTSDGTLSLVRSLHLCSKNIVNHLNCFYNGSVCVDGKIACSFGKETYLNANEETSFKLATSYPRQNFLRMGDVTIIRCKLTLSKGFPTSYLDSASTANINRESVSKLKFDWIFLDENLSDVKIRTVGEKEIPAHRLMLAAASPVFRAMFSHDMMENKIQIVDMIDVGHEVAIEVLRYIYTSNVENCDICLTIDLLAAADKYQLEDLKNDCEQILGSNLTLTNAVEILKISDKYSAKNLKTKTIDFIKYNISGSSNSDDLNNTILNRDPCLRPLGALGETC